MATPYDVIVIGAGAAGLAAARELSNSGLQVAILEARGRIGGRIYSIRDPLLDNPIELGAEFIHGRPPEIFSVVRAAELPMVEVTGRMWYAEQGQFMQSGFGSGDREAQIWEGMRQIETDQTLQNLLDTEFSGEEWEEARESISGFVQGFDAARPDRVSIHWLLKEEEAGAQIDSDHNYRLSVPYDSVPRWLLAACDSAYMECHLNTIVQEVHWQPGKVEVLAKSGLGHSLEPFRARCALVTLPLGVLQAPAEVEGAVRFTPALSGKDEAMLFIDMGKIVKVVLRFRERFWDKLAEGELGDLRFLFSSEVPVRVWWTQNPIQSPTLTAWVGNLEADRLSQQSEQLVVEQAIGALARTMGIEQRHIEALLDGWYFHNWQTDPFARGAYSYVAAGGLDAVRQLAEPVSDTLFFAGEATDTEWHTATVHGAIATGQRASKQIRERLK